MKIKKIYFKRHCLLDDCEKINLHKYKPTFQQNYYIIILRKLQTIFPILARKKERIRSQDLLL